MDLSYSTEYETFRGEVRAFLAEHWPPKGDEAALKKREQESRFRRRATEAGYLNRSIPKRYGGSEQAPDLLRAGIIREEFNRVRAPMEVAGLGMMMLVPTLLECGAEWQKEQFVARTVSGEIFWGQGYSEPNSGSDLASLRTRGELIDGANGPEWIINGQKIWSTFAQYAHYMFALVRTEPDAPTKHAGISYLLIDLKQPGITVRPLKQMTGGEEFCEVFFSDARTPAHWIVGARGEGWKVSKATLKHERSSVGGAAASRDLFLKLLELARRTPRNGKPAIADPLIRDRLVQLQGSVESHLYSSYRQLSMAGRGQDPGPVTLMNKLVSTNIGHDIARLARDIIGDDLMIAPQAEGAGGAGPEKWNNQFMGALGVAIAAGTSNIQRNVIAERGYGLPRDPATDKT
ncbi:MAG: acyl-CoA dehydrogenase-like protein [Hydrocarboniphaga sp.]|uniref:acyl-CoA dehydrogenase family protein n=1 Tax=Hydrocarboniphaga sp. TaxID=2033016 RepID=UPI00261B88BC|nr:acyl-CoA dehydrogenase family protein [Hydrocarboniphaga sp.]MDB5969905.1 acyl-CoA dehydrogenase-like protein [Hydrocarboniphaga sp.]